MYDECIFWRPVGLIRHGELVLRDSDTNGEMSIVERFPVVEPQHLVLRQLFGRGPSDSVAQQDRIKLFPEEIVSLCIGEDDGEHDTRMQVVQVQDSRPSVTSVWFLEVNRPSGARAEGLDLQKSTFNLFLKFPAHSLFRGRKEKERDDPGNQFSIPLHPLL